MSLQARPQMLPIDQAIVYPSWMEILLRDLFWLTIAIPSFSLSEEVAGSYRTKHLLCEASNTIIIIINIIIIIGVFSLIFRFLLFNMFC